VQRGCSWSPSWSSWGATCRRLIQVQLPGQRGRYGAARPPGEPRGHALRIRAPRGRTIHLLSPWAVSGECGPSEDIMKAAELLYASVGRGTKRVAISDGTGSRSCACQVMPSRPYGATVPSWPTTTIMLVVIVPATVRAPKVARGPANGNATTGDRAGSLRAQGRLHGMHAERRRVRDVVATERDMRVRDERSNLCVHW